MANATAITVNALTANSVTANPTGDTLDTGTAAVTLYADVDGETDRFIIQITNNAAQNLAVSVLAGDNPPAQRAGVGAAASGNIAQNAVKWMGPFESARFGQNDGTIGFTFTPASGTIGATIRAFKLPKNV